MTAFNPALSMLPLPSLSALVTAANALPLYRGLPVFPGMPMQVPVTSIISQSVPPAATDSRLSQRLFSQAELDMLLYGYAKPKNQGEAGLALSGLCVNESSQEKQMSKSGKSLSHAEPSSLSLPEGISIRQSSFAGVNHTSTFSNKLFKKGHLFGPYEGKVIHTSEVKAKDSNAHMWEIFQDGRLSHFIDGRGSVGKWMSYVNCARYAQEQNLTAVQIDGKMFYQACKDITAGKELLVWYGSSYDMFFGVPIGVKDPAASSSEPSNQPESIQKPSGESEGYSCERCGKVFAYKYYKDKHLKYTKCVDQGDRKFPCTLCSRSFEKRDRLRIHILHVHEKHRPHKCSVCGKCFSQSSSLNKHMRVHSGERPYKCVYCNKAFTASSILRTHIRQHSGEKPFKCKYCGKAFASHAAHDSHVRRTHSKEKQAAAAAADQGSRPCVICSENFRTAEELNEHMASHMYPEVKEPNSPAKEEINVVN